MKISLPNAAPMDPETKEIMRKEGEIKRNQNFEKITGIFGESEAQKVQPKTEGKVFEYQIKDESNLKIINKYRKLWYRAKRRSIWWRSWI